MWTCNSKPTLGEADVVVGDNEQGIVTGKVVNDMRHCELKMLKKMPSNVVSNAQFCREIALANNMVAVSVAGDGSCQYRAV
jgi:hypothetical protein